MSWRCVNTHRHMEYDNLFSTYISSEKNIMTNEAGTNTGRRPTHTRVDRGTFFARVRSCLCLVNKMLYSFRIHTSTHTHTQTHHHTHARAHKRRIYNMKCLPAIKRARTVCVINGFIRARTRAFDRAEPHIITRARVY